MLAGEAPAGGHEEQLLDKYILGSQLGQGAFGIVYSCKDTETNIDYAVKMVDQVETAVADIQQEVRMLQELKHPSIVEIHDVYYEKVFVCMVLQLCPSDLMAGMKLHWKSRGMLNAATVARIAKMMVESINWIHSKWVIHRDIKGDNFLMDRRQIEHPACRIFLSDFGTVIYSRPFQRLNLKCGTRTYWAPEFWNLNYTFPVDIWAVGVIIAGLFTAKFPFKGERECKCKKVECPKAEEGEGLIIKMLNREEGKRLTARAALKQPFLASVKTAAADKSEACDAVKPLEEEEGMPSSDVQDRRKELVERMFNAAEENQFKRRNSLRTSIKDVAGSFMVESKSVDDKVFYEWMPVGEIPLAARVDKANARKITNVDKMPTAEADEGGTATVLMQHIDTTKFGQGIAKTLEQFVEEVRTGQAVLMVDAAKKKSLVRVVELVLLRICHGSGSGRRYMVKTEESRADGRHQVQMNKLCGTKKSPHESARQTVVRLVKDRLHMEDAHVNFDWTKTECFEDEELSPSYPGVRTVYKKEIYEGVVTSTDAAVLARLGLQGAAKDQAFQSTCPNKCKRSFAWFSESTCKQNKVVMGAPPSKKGFSTLVEAPVGFSEEALQKFLRSNKVEINEEAFKEFRDELSTGKSKLIRQKGQIVRLVEVVIVELRRLDDKVLVQVEKEASGSSKSNIRLPAVKRRPDENVFVAAKRVLSKVIKISENLVVLDKEGVLMEEKPPEMSKAFNMPTIYRRLVIPAMVQDTP